MKHILRLLSLGILAALMTWSSSLAEESKDKPSSKKVPHSGGLSDLPNPVPGAVDAISRGTEDLRKKVGKAASTGANAISIQGDDKKKK